MTTTFLNSRPTMRYICGYYLPMLKLKILQNMKPVMSKMHFRSVCFLSVHPNKFDYRIQGV